MNFQENIKKWVSLDNELKTIHEKTKQLREDKNAIEEGILNYLVIIFFFVLMSSYKFKSLFISFVLLSIFFLISPLKFNM